MSGLVVRAIKQKLRILFQEPNIFFIHQEAGNVCGSIVLLHSVVTGYCQSIRSDQSISPQLI